MSRLRIKYYKFRNRAISFFLDHEFWFRFIIYIIILSILFWLMPACTIAQKSDKLEMKLDVSTRGISSDIIGVGISFSFLMEEQKAKELSDEENPSNKFKRIMLQP